MLNLDTFADIWNCCNTANNNDIWIAYSGGQDSHVLLHCLSKLKNDKVITNNVYAVHVHHGLSPHANSWATHCLNTCKNLNVPCTVVHVTIKQQHDVEAAARAQRLKVFKELTCNQGVVVLGHHMGDQAETLLYRLCRGSGPTGLMAMQMISSLGAGKILRPLLETQKSAITQYAIANNLQWIEDESNLNLKFDRNYLRHTIMPLLLHRWPQAQASISRTARLVGQLCEITKPLVSENYQRIKIADSDDKHTLPALQLNKLQEFDIHMQSLIIRHWLTSTSMRLNEKHMQSLLTWVIERKSDNKWQLNLNNWIICSSVGNLYCLNKHIYQQHHNYRQSHKNIRVNLSYSLSHGLCNCCQLTLQRSVGYGFKKLDNSWILCFAPLNAAKKYFQLYKIPLWQRHQYPLVFAQNKLIAIVGLWIHRDYVASSQELGYNFIFKKAIN